MNNSTKTIELMKEKFDSSFIENGFHFTKEDIGEVLKSGAKELGKERLSVEEGEKLFADFENSLLGKDKTAYQNVKTQAQETYYGTMYPEHVKNKNAKDDEEIQQYNEKITQLKEQQQQRNALLDQFTGKYSTDSSEIKESIDPVTWQEIQDFAQNNNNTIQGEELEKIKNIPFTKETLPSGIKKFTLNGKVFTSMSGDKYKFGFFKYKDFNKNTDDYTKGRSLDQFNNNPNYKELLTESGSQSFKNIAELCTFHCSLLQDIADELKINVTIDADYLDNSSNDDMINTLMTYLRTLTGENIVIPYKIDPDTNLVSVLGCSGIIRRVYRDVNGVFISLSFFSQVGVSRNT